MTQLLPPHSSGVRPPPLLRPCQLLRRGAAGSFGGEPRETAYDVAGHVSANILAGASWYGSQAQQQLYFLVSNGEI